MVQFVNIIREDIVETRFRESNSTGTDVEAVSLKERSPLYFCIRW